MNIDDPIIHCSDVVVFFQTNGHDDKTEREARACVETTRHEMEKLKSTPIEYIEHG